MVSIAIRDLLGGKNSRKDKSIALGRTHFLGVSLSQVTDQPY